MGIFSSLFASYSEKQIKKIIPTVDKIEALADTFSAMSDTELRAYTDKLKGDLASGKTLDDILPEAFALVREADARVLGKRPFRVQLMGGILLHQGRIAEMKTGEGKTLVATLPAYLNALSGKGVHIVTVNDYLATRDSEEMGKVYSFLGLTTGLIVHGQKSAEKRSAYAADITYGTNNELGFDYLRDNMAVYKEELVQRGHAFAIVDEVDSILIDEARTPLIISGEGAKSTDIYDKADALAKGMSVKVIKEIDKKRDTDFGEEYFFTDESEGATDMLAKRGVRKLCKLYRFDADADFTAASTYGAFCLSDGGKDKLTTKFGFEEDDLLSCGDGEYSFSVPGQAKLKKLLDKSVYIDESSGAAFITELGAHRIARFFDLDEYDFAEADDEGELYVFKKSGAEKARTELKLKDTDLLYEGKDFSFDKEKHMGIFTGVGADKAKKFCAYTSAVANESGFPVYSAESASALLTKSGAQSLERAISFDYIVDEKARTAVLTAAGVEKAERHFGIKNLSDPECAEISHHVNLAIRAHGIMKCDVDYIVKDDNVVIVDTFTGRLMPGRRYSDGLHQAIEAKEHVKVQKESKTIATITFQNYFRLYSKLSGMTGTALTEENEFREIYALDVVEVPTNKPMIRRDHNDAVYRTRRGKLYAIVQQIKACHEKGQPVLVGTVSIDKSEELSALLKKEGIPHRVLNAKQHDKEAEIVAQAGTPGTITISTNMAGRGTDIMLGGNAEYLAKARMRKEEIPEDMIAVATGTSDTDDEEVLHARATFQKYYEEYKKEIQPLAEQVKAAGGLFIIGTERHESRRIDNQLRGRSGRQGDAGETRFYLSLEDDLMRLFGSDRVAVLAEKLGFDEITPINMKMMSKAIEKAQARIEASNFTRRKNVLTYDDVMNQQRKVIYKEREEVLLTDNISEKIVSMIKQSVSDTFDECFAGDDYTLYTPERFSEHYRGALTGGAILSYSEDELKVLDKDKEKACFTEKALEVYHSKDEIAAKIEGFPENAMREIEKVLLLKHVDTKWMEHLEAMDELKGYVGLNSYAQRDPVTVYRLEGADMFDKMIADIREDTVIQLLAGVPGINSTKRERVVKATGFGGSASATAAVRRPTVRKSTIVGRNEPCPCGSGKKYKNCCWAKDQAEK